MLSEFLAQGDDHGAKMVDYGGAPACGFIKGDLTLFGQVESLVVFDDDSLGLQRLQGPFRRGH